MDTTEMEMNVRSVLQRFKEMVVLLVLMRLHALSARMGTLCILMVRMVLPELVSSPSNTVNSCLSNMTSQSTKRQKSMRDSGVLNVFPDTPGTLTTKNARNALTSLITAHQTALMLDALNASQAMSLEMTVSAGLNLHIVKNTPGLMMTLEFIALSAKKVSFSLSMQMSLTISILIPSALIVTMKLGESNSARLVKMLSFRIFFTEFVISAREDTPPVLPR